MRPPLLLTALAATVLLAGCGGADRERGEVARQAEPVVAQASRALASDPECATRPATLTPPRLVRSDAPAALRRQVAILRRPQTQAERRLLAPRAVRARYVAYSAAAAYRAATRVVAVRGRRFAVTVARLDNRFYDESHRGSFAECIARERAAIERRTNDRDVRAAALRLIETQVAAYRRRPQELAIALARHPGATFTSYATTTAFGRHGVVDQAAGVVLVPDGVVRVRIDAGVDDQRRVRQTAAVADNVAAFAPRGSTIFAMRWLRSDGSVVRDVEVPVNRVALCIEEGLTSDDPGVSIC